MYTIQLYVDIIAINSLPHADANNWRFINVPNPNSTSPPSPTGPPSSIGTSNPTSTASPTGTTSQFTTNVSHSNQVGIVVACVFSVLCGIILLVFLVRVIRRCTVTGPETLPAVGPD